MPIALRSLPIKGITETDWLDSAQSPPGRWPSFASSSSTIAWVADVITRRAGHTQDVSAATKNMRYRRIEGQKGGDVGTQSFFLARGKRREGGRVGEEGRGRERDIQSRVISRGAARWPLGIELVDLRINLFCSRRYSAENGMSAWCAEKMSLLSEKKKRDVPSFLPTFPYLPLPLPSLLPLTSRIPLISLLSFLSFLLSLSSYLMIPEATRQALSASSS